MAQSCPGREHGEPGARCLSAGQVEHDHVPTVLGLDLGHVVSHRVGGFAGRQIEVGVSSLSDRGEHVLARRLLPEDHELAGLGADEVRELRAGFQIRGIRDLDGDSGRDVWLGIWPRSAAHDRVRVAVVDQPLERDVAEPPGVAQGRVIGLAQIDVSGIRTVAGGRSGLAGADWTCSQ